MLTTTILDFDSILLGDYKMFELNNSEMQVLNTATAISDAFSVRKLEEVSKIELEEGQYLVRKIEKGTGLESKGCIIPPP